MKNIRDFLSQILQFLEVKFSTCLNRHVFLMLILSEKENPEKFNVSKCR